MKTKILMVGDEPKIRESRSKVLRMEGYEVGLVANRQQDINEPERTQRKALEEALKQSELRYSQLMERSNSQQEQVRRLTSQILSAQEDERKRISRELHDIISQTLTSINVRLTILKKEIALKSKDLDHNITCTQRRVEKSMEILDDFARELRPPVLDDLGLIPALKVFMRDFAARTGVRTRLTAFARVEQLDIALRTVLFRVAQEALTNVDRHARASRAEVSINKLPDSICISIRDDGKSFQVQGLLQANGNTRLGLLGMRERVEMVGGSFSIESASGIGTRIRAQIPLTSVRAPTRGARSSENLVVSGRNRQL